MEKLINELKESLKEERFYHTLGVAETAKNLAKHYGIDEKKAYLAGLLHDCAKNLGYEELYKRADFYKIELDPVAKSEPKLLHAYVGAYMARDKYKISDDEIFDAIYYHTTGKEDMSLFSKIVFLADLIEPGREKYDFFKKAKELAYKDIDEALIFVMESTMLYIIKQGGLLHTDTVKARNFLVERRKDKENGN